ncbi:hypothetical protein HMPREF3193_00469 [Bifidobacterium breve]|nr:hypothetical protein HMPREF3193_00469 [Bifidobacterium breve]
MTHVYFHQGGNDSWCALVPTSHFCEPTALLQVLPDMFKLCH